MGGGNYLLTNNPLENYTYFPDLGTVFIANYSYAINPHLVMTVGASWLGELNFQIPQRAQTDALPNAPGAPIISGIGFNGFDSPSSTNGANAGFGTSNTNSINRKLGVALR